MSGRFKFEKDCYKARSHFPNKFLYRPLPVINPGYASMLTSGMAFLSAQLTQKKKGLSSVKEFLLKNGFADEQIDYVLTEKKKSVAEEIIEILSKGWRKNKFPDLAPRFGSDLAAPIEQNRGIVVLFRGFCD